MAILNLEWPLPNPPKWPKTARAPPSRRCGLVCSVKPSFSSLLEEFSEPSSEIQIIRFHADSSPHRPTSIPDIESSDKSVTESADTSNCRVPADPIALGILIMHLLESKDWSSISSLAEDFKSSGVFPGKSSCVRLIAECVRARKLRVVDTLLAAFETHSHSLATAAFGAALRGYNELHMYSSMILLHDRMVRAGIAMDSSCYCSVMDAYRKLGNVDRVLLLFHELRSTELCLSPTMLSRIYFILCDSLGRSGRAFEALRFFREMEENGIPPRSPFYASLICAFATAKEAELTSDLYVEAKEKGLVRDPSIFLKMVLMYVEVGVAGKTLEVVKEMMEMGYTVSDCVLCAVVNGHVKNGELRSAVTAYEELIGLGCFPGQVTYTSMINVYCRLGLSEKAQILFDEMLQSGFSKCVVAYANMVSMYGKSGKIRDAMRLLATMKEKGCAPNVWVYNSLIDMHGKAMNLRQVEKLWKEMKRRKIDPDKVSYTSIIGAYSKAREFKECCQYYREFRLNGGKIDRAMVGLMVGVFSKTSMIHELIKLLQDSKAEGISMDERLYRSVLNALRDAGLETQVKWFKDSFAYAEAKSEYALGQSIQLKKIEKSSIE